MSFSSRGPRGMRSYRLSRTVLAGCSSGSNGKPAASVQCCLMDGCTTLSEAGWFVRGAEWAAGGGGSVRPLWWVHGALGGGGVFRGWVVFWRGLFWVVLFFS